MRTENAQLKAELEAAQAERDRVSREFDNMKREAEESWASERVENALLRERINDVAAEVARLTAVLEGPGSTINTILASPEPAMVNVAAKPAANDEGPPSHQNGEARGSLADRIRALQARSSRLSSAT